MVSSNMPTYLSKFLIAVAMTVIVLTDPAKPAMKSMNMLRKWVRMLKG